MPFPEEAPGTVGLPPTLQNLNNTMDLQNAGLFILVWISVMFLMIYLLAVYQSNKQRKKEDREKYKNNPIDVFWRNLK